MTAARGSFDPRTTASTATRTAFATVAMTASTRTVTAWATVRSGNAGCVDTTTDSNDGDGSVCADTDGDSCDDCAVAAFDPSNDGLDADGDGVCALGDCDDDKPLCASVCTDVDDDGYCIDTDCDDMVPSCDLDCATNTDGDPHVDCFESFCGSDPADGGSECLEVSDEIEYEAAIDAANANPGHDYIVLNDFTMTSDPRGITDDAGAHHSAGRGRHCSRQLGWRPFGLQAR